MLISNIHYEELSLISHTIGNKSLIYTFKVKESPLRENKMKHTIGSNETLRFKWTHTVVSLMHKKEEIS